MEGQLREHEASRHAVGELLKFAQNEANAIIAKIQTQVSTCYPAPKSTKIIRLQKR